MTVKIKSKPYDRQPNETDKSWAAFCVYRDMGRERSLEKVDQLRSQTSPKKSLSYLKEWSLKHGWVKRCSAFDDDELEKESIMLQKERLNRRLQMEKDAWNRRDKLIKKADTIARVPLLKPEVSGDGTQIFMPTDKWSVKDAIAFYEYSDKLGIFATGGEKPKMDIIDAINLLATNDVLPPEFAVIASQGIEKFKNLLRELLKNGTGDVNEQFEPTEPIGAFSDILRENSDTTSPVAAKD
jgi:hypothetical protein